MFVPNLRMGGVMKTERVFISPHFCLENLPSKFLPCKLTLWGEEVKTLTIFSSLTKIL